MAQKHRARLRAALELIRAVETNGGYLRVDGEDLVISPANAATPVMKELREHKPGIDSGQR
jgi:hypothetical protein